MDEGKAGRGLAGRREGAAGASAGRSDTEEGAVSWPLRGPGGSGLRLQTADTDGVPLVGRVKLKWWQATARGGGGEESGSRRKRFPSDIPEFPHLAG